MADFSSLSPYLKLYDLGPVETELVIPLPESSSVISPSISPVLTVFVPSSTYIIESVSSITLSPSSSLACCITLTLHDL